MRKESFIQFAEGQGFTVCGSEAYGRIGEYPVRLINNGSKVMILFTLDKQSVKAVAKPAKLALKGIGGFQKAAPQTVSVSFKASDSDASDRYREISKAMLGALNEANAHVPDACPICKNSGCDSAMLYAGQFQPVHAECVKNMHSAATDKADKNAASGSYLFGLLGGIIGGIIACIPTLLVIWYTETVYSLLYALIPLGAYYGYKLMRGKMNKIAIAIIVAVSVVNAILIDFFLIAVALVTEGYPLSLLWDILGDAEVISSMMPDFMTSLVFIALGILISWKQISRTSASAVSDIENALDTMVPLRGNAVAGTVRPQPEKV